MKISDGRSIFCFQNRLLFEIQFFKDVKFSRFFLDYLPILCSNTEAETDSQILTYLIENVIKTATAYVQC